jgi:hypothetical protein
MNKPLQHVPFPDISNLKSVLDNPKIKEILPGNIYEGNSCHKTNGDGAPYFNFEKLASSHVFLDNRGLKNLWSLASEGGIIVDSWRGKDYSKSNFPRTRVVGSYATSDGDVGILKISLKKESKYFIELGRAHQDKWY